VTGEVLTFLGGETTAVKVPKLVTRHSALYVLLLVAAACAIPASGDFGAPETTTPGEVPFELAAPNDAAILVPVKIDGKGPFKFVMDTGAIFTCTD
jgi:hypothetical protein